MIISCPVCSRNFRVEDAHFADKKARRVKCGGCKHKWMQKWEAPPPLPEPVTTFKKRKKKESRGGVAWLIFFLILFIGTPAFFVLMRNHVVAWCPKITPFYTMLGLPVHLTNHHFHFFKTNWETYNKEGQPYLRVAGTISYTPEEDIAHALPNVVVTVYGLGVCEAQSWWSKVVNGEDKHLSQGLCKIDQWQFHPPDTIALPGEKIPLESEKPYDGKAISPKVVALEFRV